MVFYGKFANYLSGYFEIELITDLPHQMNEFYVILIFLTKTRII